MVRRPCRASRGLGATTAGRCGMSAGAGPGAVLPTPTVPLSQTVLCVRTEPACARSAFPGDYTAGYPLPDAAGNTNFGTNANKLVTITANTGANRVYIYNANIPTTATAYPKLLDSTSDGSTLTFQTFQPIVWAETAPTH